MNLRVSYLPGSGAHRSACSEIRAVRMVSAGVHSFLRMSRQMAPVCELILGCQIFVSNFIYTQSRANANLVKSLKSHNSIILRIFWDWAGYQHGITTAGSEDSHFTYLRWLERVLVGDHDVYYESTLRVACV